MIPRTFPSIVEALTTKMVVYVLPSIAGKTAWIDYIPVKGVTTESSVLENTYANGGYQVMKSPTSLVGKKEWIDYIPVYEDASYNKPWSTDAGGYIPAGGPFGVESLFINGEQGAWYDPSDVNVNWRRNLLRYTEQFDNAAWTKNIVTVTANTVVAPDGTLTADKIVTTASAGAQYFVAQNASYVAGTVYTASVYLKKAEYQYAQLTLPSAAAGSSQYANFDLDAGTITFQTGGSATIVNVGDGWYRCSWTAVATITVASGQGAVILIDSGLAARVPLIASAGSLGIFIWGAQLEVGTVATSYQRIVTPEITYLADVQPQPVLFQDSAGTTPVTAVEQPVGLMLDKSGNNNHAFQATSASRPVLSARVNLLTKTEQFDDAAWIKIGSGTGVAPVVTANAAIAPDNTLTAGRVVFNKGAGATTSDLSVVQQALSTGINGIAGLHVKADAPVRIVFRVSGTWVPIDATTEWQFFAIPASLALSASSVQIGLRDGYGIPNVPNSATVYLWGADLRVANDGVGIPAYQRVNTATDYDTTGFPLYLRCDGVDDSLSTNSIDFTSTDKMTVFAGVRKLSDVAVGVVAELSANWGANPGSFNVSAPGDAGQPRYSVGVVGAFVGTGTYAGVESFAAPTTNVVALRLDNGATTVSTRIPLFDVNGVSQTLVNTGGNLTAGNFGNYPLFIGRRGIATAPFNGRLYSLIVRGAQSTTAQITSTESYMNKLTKAF